MQQAENYRRLQNKPRSLGWLHSPLQSTCSQPWQQQDGRTGGSTLPGARADESHSSYACTAIPAVWEAAARTQFSGTRQVQGSCGIWDKQTPLGPQRHQFHLPAPCCSLPNFSQALGEQERSRSIRSVRMALHFPSPCLDPHHWKQRWEQVILMLSFMVPLFPRERKIWTHHCTLQGVQ